MNTAGILSCFMWTSSWCILTVGCAGSAPTPAVRNLRTLRDQIRNARDSARIELFELRKQLQKLADRVSLEPPRQAIAELRPVLDIRQRWLSPRAFRPGAGVAVRLARRRDVDRQAHVEPFARNRRILSELDLPEQRFHVR